MSENKFHILSRAGEAGADIIFDMPDMGRHAAATAAAPFYVVSIHISVMVEYSTLCGIPSVMIFCKACLTCSTVCWTDTAETVMPNG